MRPVQNRSAELDRLDRVLSAVARQRSADEYDRRQPIHQTELTERVDDVDIVMRLRQPAARALRGRQAGVPGNLGNTRAALGMARRDDGEELRKRVAEPPVSLDQRGLLASVGRGRGDG